MTLRGPAARGEAVHFIEDYVGLDCHDDGHTQIDALCHVAYRGVLYNGHSEDLVTSHGARAGPASDGDAAPRRPRSHGTRLGRNNDTAPSTTRGRRLPDPRARDHGHGDPPARLRPARGLLEACERKRRWEFLFVAVPLRIVGARGHRSTPWQCSDGSALARRRPSWQAWRYARSTTNTAYLPATWLVGAGILGASLIHRSRVVVTGRGSGRICPGEEVHGSPVPRSVG